MKRLYGAIPSRMRSALRCDLRAELLTQRRRQPRAHVGDLPAHLLLRALPLGRQDEKADRRHHRRQDDAGDVGRRCRGGDRDDRAEPEGAGADGGGGGHRISRTVGQLLRLAPPIVGIDHLAASPGPTASISRPRS